jgi:hypothetical protein
MNPDGPHNGQEQREAGWKQAKNLVWKAHGLSRGQGRIPDLQDSLAGRQRLLEAAVLSDEVLIKSKFLSFTQNNRIIKNKYIKRSKLIQKREMPHIYRILGGRSHFKSHNNYLKNGSPS